MEESGEIDKQAEKIEGEELDHERNFASSVNDAVNRERRPGDPNIKLSFLFGYHESEKDAEKFKQEVRNSDIVIPEAEEWDEDVLQTYRDVAAGVKTADDVDEEWGGALSGYSYAQLEALFDTQKKITIVDIPSDYLIAQESEVGHTDNAYIDQVLNSTRSNIENIADRHRVREQYMISQISPKIRELLANDQQLKVKEDVNVLMTLGGFHTGVYHAVKKSGYESDRTFDNSPMIYDFKSEGVRKFIFDRENKVGDLLLARIYCEEVFDKLYDREMQSEIRRNSKIAMFKRKVFSMFNLEEIKNIFNQGNLTPPERLADAMINKGVVIPHSEQEIDELMAKPFVPPNEASAE